MINKTAKYAHDQVVINVINPSQKFLFLHFFVVPQTVLWVS